VKQKAVEILWKFGKDRQIQNGIIEYGDSIMTVLSLLNREAFIDIAYRMILQLEIGGVHYNDIKRQITRHLEEEFDDDQYSNEENHILALIRFENIRSSRFLLPEHVLESIISENVDSAYQYALNLDDLNLVSKSRQILDFQKQSECALMVQSMFRSFTERKKYKIEIRRNQQYEADLDDEAEESAIIDDEESEDDDDMESLKLENERQKDMIQKLRSDLITLQHHVHTQKSQLVQKLNAEIAELRERDIERETAMEEMKDRHLMDKQQFALQMMEEMNRLREELKQIGKLSLNQTQSTMQTGDS